MTLGKALQIAEDASTAQAYWLPLSKKRSTDTVGGELCLGFEVLDAASHAQVTTGLKLGCRPQCCKVYYQYKNYTMLANNIQIA